MKTKCWATSPEKRAKEEALKNLPEFEEVMEYFADLTPREIDIFVHIGQGLSNEDIGKCLFISPLTVRTHVKHIHDKLDIAGRARLAVAAARVCHAFDSE